MKNGDLLHNPATQSHEDLIQLHNLHDSKVGNFAKVEFYPDDNIDLGDISKYKLHIDDDIIPEWFDDSIWESTERKLRVILKRIVIIDHRKFLIGGCYLLAGHAKIDVIKNTYIIQMRDSSRVDIMFGSSRVRAMWESSSVGEMWESSSVRAMWESSSVGAMYNASSICEMYHSSNVCKMWDYSKVGEMFDSSSIAEMRGGSSVGAMYDFSKIINNDRSKD